MVSRTLRRLDSTSAPTSSDRKSASVVVPVRSDPKLWTWVPLLKDLYDDYPCERYIPSVPCAYAVPVDRIKGKPCPGCDEYDCGALFPKPAAKESLEHGRLLGDQDVRADFERQENKVMREWNDLSLDKSHQVLKHDDWDPDYDEIETVVGQPSPRELNIIRSCARHTQVSSAPRASLDS